MELRHLRYFVAAADELNISRAAHRLKVSQPPLSRQIHDLEAEIGTALFDRTRKKLQLTPAGAHFLQEARKILQHVERAARTARAKSSVQAGQLRIAFLSPLAGLALPRAVRAFRQKFPLVDIELVEMTPRSQLEALRDHEVDLALLARLEAEPYEELAAESVRNVRMRLAIPPDHELSRLRRIPIARLAQEPMITLKRSAAPASHELLLTLCRTAGFEPNLVKLCDRVQGILDLVAAGIGVAILPETFRRYRPELVWRGVVPELPAIPLCMVWRKDDNSPALEALRRFILLDSGRRAD